MNNCIHHWLIAPPDGTMICHATCKKCRAERDFHASLRNGPYNADPGMSRKAENLGVQDPKGSRRTF